MFEDDKKKQGIYQDLYDQDDGGEAAAPIAKAATPPSAADLAVTPEDLKSAADEKRRIALMGGIANSLSNQQSFGNFFLGHMNAKQDNSDLTKTLMDQADEPVKTKQLLQKQELERPNLEMAQQSLDKDSPLSQSKRGMAKAGITALQQMGVFKSNPKIVENLLSSLDNASGAQIDKMMAEVPLLKQASENQRTMAMLSGMEMRGRSLDMRADEQAARAAGEIDKNPLIQSAQRQLNQIGVDRHTLSSAKVITPQMVHEIGAGIASALNQGKSVGLGQMELQDMGTSQTKIAQLEQMLTNKPQNGASPEIRQQMLDTLDRLEDSYKRVQAATVKQLAVGKNYAHNPMAQQALQQKVGQYTGGSDATPGADAQAGALDDNDKQALQWAKQNPKDPRAAQILMKLNKKVSQ